ncbi:MAG TPA: hypothetical protein VLQ68_09550 [Rhizobiaceae bacterium]|nr:hypothetical protein [Rhizobiaceae bacterium]
MAGHGLKRAQIAATGLALLVSTGASLAQSEKPEDIIAVQLRSQGFACENPRDAKEDTADTKPDEKAWTIQCDGQQYRIRFVPDMAAQVEKID